MNKSTLIIIASFLFSISMHGQEQQFSLDSIINNAPANVKEYYRVFDSLARPTWKTRLYKLWSDAELKKYASMIYDADEYDAITKNKADNIRYKEIRELKKGYVVTHFSVIQEMQKRFQPKYAQLVQNAYWLTIMVEDIETLPYSLKDNPKIKFTKKRIHGTVTGIWKGKLFKVGDSVTCYYHTFWNYRGITKGSSYIVALYLVIQEDTPDRIDYALGGPNTVQRSIFPIENDYVIDADNFFGLGNKVDLKTFTDSLTSAIDEIKSWEDGSK